MDKNYFLVASIKDTDLDEASDKTPAKEYFFNNPLVFC